MSVNAITATGLTTQSQSDLLTQYTTGFELIYGDDIDLDPDTPDGQQINIAIQANLDNLNLITLVNSFFDPDQAVGVILDQRISINGIAREGGTFTITNVTLVISQACTLPGLDLYPNAPYTVQDNAGNQWELVTTQTPGAPGSYVYVFEAANPGAIQTVINTITVPVSIVLGVQSINNPTTYTTLGINEETDAAVKIRRRQSVSNASQGFYNSLYGTLLNVNGVSSVEIFENYTSITDGNGVPGHSIWVIVGGSASAAAIAQAIYSKRNAGCGMLGSSSYVITQVDGTPFTVFYDIVQQQALFIKFTATSLNGINPPNIAAITSVTSGLPAIYTPGVNAEVNINQLATLVQQIDPNTLVTSAGFCLTYGGSFTNTLSPSQRNYQFAVSAADIIILPMILSPTTITVAPLGTQQFTGLGGYGTLTYSISVNNSGGSINSSSGLYTAGSTPNVADTILVTDSLSNTATATVNVS